MYEVGAADSSVECQARGLRISSMRNFAWIWRSALGSTVIQLGLGPKHMDIIKRSVCKLSDESIVHI